MFDLIEYLEELDLTENDANIYLFLLKEGASTPSEIAKKTKLVRARIYDALKRLMDKGFVTHNIENKRPKYMCSSPQLLISELENKIARKKEALDIIQSELMDSSLLKRIKGIFFYNTNAAARLRLHELMTESQKKITIMAVIPSSLQDEDLFPIELFTQKSLAGQKITLILNVSEDNWELCAKLAPNNVQIYHYPILKKILTLIHLIDDNSLCISPIKRHNGLTELEYCMHFSGKQEIITAFDFLLQNFISQSKSLKDRFEELKSIIHSTISLKSIFGIKE